MMVKNIALVTVCAGLVASCDSVVDVSNSVPRVTWVAVSAAVDGVADVTVWISDIEGDPVNLTLNWRSAGEPSEGETIAQGDGGHGTTGLTTHLEIGDPNGQPHLITWDVSGISGQVELRLVPSDASGAGAAVLSPAFDISVGIPEAQALVAAD